MPFFRVSVTRPQQGTHVRAQAGMIWFDQAGHQEVELAEVYVELGQGPAKSVLARALGALVMALEEADQGV